MRPIPAFTGELGMKLRYHVPWVHHLNVSPKVVEIERGEEALYPSADRFVLRDREHDDKRRGWKGWTRPPSLKRAVPPLFVPTPYDPPQIPACPIVICPRWRDYGPSKNWPHWDELAMAPGVFAAGAPDSSRDVACPAAWNHDRFLDASIQAMINADLVVATMNGLAVLAMMLGKPLVLILWEGRPAPGPVSDASGRVMLKEYGAAPIQEFIYDMNHLSAPIEIVNAWDDPGAVLEKMFQVAK